MAASPDKNCKPGNKAYLTEMSKETIVQFVCFETLLDSEEFINEWERYTRSANNNTAISLSDWDITLQQTRKKSVFRYIAQHRCLAGQSGINYTKATRISRNDKAGIKGTPTGGYTILQSERTDETGTDESKIFAFLINPQADLNTYRELFQHCKLNIYAAYYESCQYAYILEFFVKNEYTAELLLQLRQHTVAESGIYKECVLEALEK